MTVELNWQRPAYQRRWVYLVWEESSLVFFFFFFGRNDTKRMVLGIEIRLLSF